MLRITGVDPLVIDPVRVSENSIIDGLGNSKVGKAEIDVITTMSKSQDKSKNW